MSTTSEPTSKDILHGANRDKAIDDLLTTVMLQADPHNSTNEALRSRYRKTLSDCLSADKLSEQVLEKVIDRRLSAWGTNGDPATTALVKASERASDLKNDLRTNPEYHKIISDLATNTLNAQYQKCLWGGYNMRETEKQLLLVVETSKHADPSNERFLAERDTSKQLPPGSLRVLLTWPMNVSGIHNSAGSAVLPPLRFTQPQSQALWFEVEDRHCETTGRSLAQSLNKLGDSVKPVIEGDLSKLQQLAYSSGFRWIEPLDSEGLFDRTFGPITPPLTAEQVAEVKSALSHIRSVQELQSKLNAMGGELCDDSQSSTIFADYLKRYVALSKEANQCGLGTLGSVKVQQKFIPSTTADKKDWTIQLHLTSDDGFMDRLGTTAAPIDLSDWAQFAEYKEELKPEASAIAASIEQGSSVGSLRLAQ